MSETQIAIGLNNKSIMIIDNHNVRTETWSLSDPARNASSAGSVFVLGEDEDEVEDEGPQPQSLLERPRPGV